MSRFFLSMVASVSMACFAIAAERPAAPASTSSAILVLHLTFDSSGRPDAATVIDAVTGKELEVRHGNIGPGQAGLALRLTGHPDQGVPLGTLDFHQPATVAFWVKRAAAPVLASSGEKRPEYTQEHGLGKGRLLSPLTGVPHQQSGALRIGPEKLEVWHAADHWSVLIPGPLPAEEWMHLAVTFAEDLRATGYLNGRRQNTTRAAFNFGNSPVALAAAALDKRYGFPLAGALDDVRLYRGVLTEAEIVALAAAAPTK